MLVAGDDVVGTDTLVVQVEFEGDLHISMAWGFKMFSGFWCFSFAFYDSIFGFWEVLFAFKYWFLSLVWLKGFCGVLIGFLFA